MTARRPRLLWFKSRMPGVVHDGSSFVTLNLARCLSEAFEIDLVTQELRGTERDLAPTLSPPFRRVEVVRPSNRGGALRRMAYRALYEVVARIRGWPRGALYGSDSGVRRAIRRTLAAETYDLAVLEYWTSGLVLSDLGDVPAAILLHDATFEALEQEAERAANAGARRRGRRLARRVRAFEVDVAKRARCAFVLSPADEATFRALGVENARYLPVVLPPRPSEGPSLEGERVLFVGGLGHAPNVDAALWLTDEIWPRIRRARPTAILDVVGGPLSPDLVARLERTSGVRALGHVDDLAPLVQGASLGIAPMRMGTGVKTKILDWMWRGLPVVATPGAVTGTPGDAGGALVADTAGGLAEAVVGLLADREARRALRDRAWTLLEERHSGPEAHHRVRERFLACCR